MVCASLDSGMKLLRLMELYKGGFQEWLGTCSYKSEI